MKIPITEELKEICRKIIETNWNESQWAEHQAEDWFQSDNSEGGYDADENAFCFSYYTPEKEEFWFQFSLPDVTKIIEGKITFFDGRGTE